MIGAIVGDIIGSRFEGHKHNHKSKDFNLFSGRCRFTDDTVMTLALCDAFLVYRTDKEKSLSEIAVSCMQSFGKIYPHAGYGKKFKKWIFSLDPKPYDSYGNGAAMRVSSCAYVAKTLDEARGYAKEVTAVTHNHPEGIKGALSITDAIFLARQGMSLDAIRKHILENYYQIDFKLDEIREDYTFSSSCTKSVPQALESFFESTDFEDTIRNAISIGGDSDTIAAIAGSIAEAFYGIPDTIREEAFSFLDERLQNIVNDFESHYPV